MTRRPSQLGPLARPGTLGGCQCHWQWPEQPESGIWKPIMIMIPVRIFYTFVIYQGYDMDILSGKRYDVIYQGYDMDIPNANNLELHILVIYFLTFGQIF